MARASHPGAYVRFAGVSLAVCIALSVALILIAAQLSHSHAERNAVRATDALLGTPLRTALDGSPALTTPLAAETIARLDSVAKPLLSDELRAVDVWTAGGQLAYSTRPDVVLSPGSLPEQPGLSSSRTRSTGGENLLIVSSNNGRYTIRVTQSAAAVDDAASGFLATVGLLIASGATAAFVLLQAAFWFAISGVSAAHRRLRHLYDSGQEIRSSLDLQEVLTQLTRDSTQLARGQYGMITLFDEETGDLELKTTYKAETDIVGHDQRRVEEWFFRRCAATNTTIVSIQPVLAYRQLYGSELDLEGRIALLCVPLSLRDRVVGVVAVIRTLASPYGGFGPAEVQLVEEIAGQAVMAVEQALLFNKMRTYADELELSYDTTLKVLMAALDTKDEVTEGHCERVSKLTVHLARRMEVPDRSLVDIERGALLHDVGKIGVPDTVLKKPQALNRQEWEAMQKHPLLAGLIVSKVGFLEGALPILLYHHERFDGQGYPFGLLREKIPLEARIFSVVDSYDAMTSNRPYRSAMSYEDAMEELRRNSGTQFDPDIVEVFEALMLERPDLRNHEHDAHSMSSLHDDHDLLPPSDDGAEDAA